MPATTSSVAVAGNDVLIGGAGNDTLTGGTGIDRMIFEEVGAANQDTINAYAGTGADRDILDLSGLLDANFSVGNIIANFVQITDTGTNTRSNRRDWNGKLYRRRQCRDPVQLRHDRQYGDALLRVQHHSSYLI